VTKTGAWHSHARTLDVPFTQMRLVASTSMEALGVRMKSVVGTIRMPKTEVLMNLRMLFSR
jgi:hypothetical protein